MKRKIIVPIDFSPCSLHAAGYALSLARVFHADIELFNLCHPHPEAAVSGTGNRSYSEDNGQRAHTIYMLESLALSLSRAQPDPKIEFQPRVSFFFAQGSLCEETMSRSRSGAFSLAVIGLLRKNGFFSVKLGPDLIQLVRESVIPIICVPEQYTFRLPKKLAFATGLELNDIPILRDFLSFSRTLNADVLILHADLGKAEKPGTLDFNGFLSRASAEMDFNGVSHRSIISRQLTPALEYAIDGGDIEILAMTHHNRGGFRRLLSKDHIKPLLRSTRIPLLFYHSPQDGEQL